MKKIFVLWLSLLLLLAACSEEEGDPPQPPEPPDEPTVEELLTGNWNITGLEIDGESRTLNSQDQVVFDENGTYTMTLPELSFFPDEGSWSLTNNDTKLSINSGDYTFDIDSLDEDDMVLTLNYDNFKSETIVYQLTFEKN